MRQRMNRVGVFAPDAERALGDPPSGRNTAVFGVRPAEIGQEPPVVAIVAGIAFAQIHPRLIMVRHPRKREQSKGAERQHQNQGIARPAFEMCQRQFEGADRLALRGQRQDLDMAFFPRAAVAFRQPARHRGFLLRRRHLGIEQMYPRAGGIG